MEMEAILLLGVMFVIFGGWFGTVVKINKHIWRDDSKCLNKNKK